VGTAPEILGDLISSQKRHKQQEKRQDHSAEFRNGAQRSHFISPDAIAEVWPFLNTHPGKKKHYQKNQRWPQPEKNSLQFPFTFPTKNSQQSR
jgi:hypothetical protein